MACELSLLVPELIVCVPVIMECAYLFGEVVLFRKGNWSEPASFFRDFFFL